MDETTGWIMTDGNTAGAIGALYGGVQFTAWYPITPASSLAEAFHELDLFYAGILKPEKIHP